MSIAARRGRAFAHHQQQRDDHQDAFAAPPPSAATGGSAAAIDRVVEASRSTGTLNLSSRGLSRLPDSVCKPPDAAAATPWWESVETTRLDVSRNELEELPESLFADLPALQVLDVRCGLFLFLGRRGEGREAGGPPLPTSLSL